MDEDISESESDNDDDDDDGNNCNDDLDEQQQQVPDDIEDSSINHMIRLRKKIRERKIRQSLKRFRRLKISHNNECLIETERDVVLPILRHLSRNDLLNCMIVSKNWNSKYFIVVN